MRRTFFWPPAPAPEAGHTKSPDTTFETTVVEDLPRPIAPPPPAGTPEVADGSPIGHVGRYTLEKVLGEGGLGTVYQAQDPLLSRTVAVKTLHRGASLSQDSTDRILHEARAAARLSHAHIVTVFDAGSSERGVYIAMELLQGQDLRQALREGWRPTPTEAASLVRKVADALDYAHSKGVVHCDIKPANIFLVNRKHPKVLDFGIARLSQGDRVSVDMPITGSPFYLAPEQLKGEPLDRRSDVYALGVVLFELLSGQRPYVGDSMEAISQAVLNAPTPQLRQLNPKVGPNLSALVAKAMARNPADRPASAKLFSQALRRWAETSEADRSRPSSLTPRTAAYVGGAALLAALATAWLQQHWTAEPEVPPHAAAVPPPQTPAPEGPPPSTAAPQLISAHATATPAPEPVPITPSSPQPEPTPAPAVAAKRPAPVPLKRGTEPSNSRPVTSPAAPLPTGVLHLAVSPWGQVEVDGRSVGTTPPLTQLPLPVGSHAVTIRNGDLSPYSTTVTITEDGHARVQHRFAQ